MEKSLIERFMNWWGIETEGDHFKSMARTFCFEATELYAREMKYISSIRKVMMDNTPMSKTISEKADQLFYQVEAYFSLGVISGVMRRESIKRINRKREELLKQYDC